MKKFLTMVVAALLATNVQAQFKPGTWSIQPMVGVGVSNISGVKGETFYGTTIDKIASGAGLVGAEFEYQMDKKFSVAAGINFTMQGCGWEDFKMSGVEYKNSQIELSYIKIPVVANYHIYKGLAVKAGVQFAFLTDADAKMTCEGKSSGRKTTINTRIDCKDDVKTFDFAIPFGLSYESTKHWVFDLRYQLGLTNINKNDDGTYKNGLLMLTVGKKFKF